MSNPQDDIFEYFDMPEEDFELAIKRDNFELLKSKIQIGDSYSDIKAKLATLDLLKGRCTSYTDYYLTDLNEGADGFMFANCSYSEVSCWLGNLPSVKFCRLKFNRDKTLIAIENY